MDELFGWVQGSDMPSIYVHLSGRDVDGALLKTYGIISDTQQSNGSQFRPKACPRCKMQNPPTNKFCSRCGSVLDEQTAHELMKATLERKQTDEIMDRLIQDSEFRDMLKQKLEELKGAG